MYYSTINPALKDFIQSRSVGEILTDPVIAALITNAHVEIMKFVQTLLGHKGQSKAAALKPVINKEQL